MAKHKRNQGETTSLTTVVIEDNPLNETTPSTLQEALISIRKTPGVTGYILKNQTNATFDLEDFTKLSEYAMLSSETFDTYDKLQSLYHLGNMENALIECSTLKLLCTTKGENAVTVFMEKTTDCTEILQKLPSSTV